MKEAISITQFRFCLGSYCRNVKIGKQELIVTYHDKPFFEVKKLTEKDNLATSSLTDTRDKMSQFIDLLEEHESVTLTANKKPVVQCVKL